MLFLMSDKEEISSSHNLLQQWLSWDSLSNCPVSFAQKEYGRARGGGDMSRPGAGSQETSHLRNREGQVPLLLISFYSPFASCPLLPQLSLLHA